MNQPNLIASETEDKNIITIVKKRPRVDDNTVLDDPALYKQIEYCEAVKRAKFEKNAPEVSESDVVDAVIAEAAVIHKASSARLPGATPATAADVTNAVAEIKSLVLSLENARIREKNCKAVGRNNYPLYCLIKEVAARGGHPALMGTKPTLNAFPKTMHEAQTLTQQTINALSTFYDNDFGIVDDDLLDEKRRKFIAWITDPE